MYCVRRNRMYRAPQHCGSNVSSVSSVRAIWPEFGCVYHQALELKGINADVFAPADAVASKSQEDKSWLFWRFLPFDLLQVMKVHILRCPGHNDIALTNAQMMVSMMIAG